MSSILNDLYYGRISPWERSVSDYTQRGKISEQITNQKGRLLEKLPPEEHALLEELENLWFDYSDLDQCDAFCAGFQLGAKLLASVYQPM